MIAMVRYQFALLGHSQRYLPAALVFLGVLALLYKDPMAPVLPEFAVSAGAMAAIACWLTIALVDVEDPVQRLITLSHARRRPVVLAALVGTVLACCLGLAMLSMGWALVLHVGLTGAEIGLGALAHLACACTGLALGLPCSRLLVPRIGYTIALAVPALTAVLLVRQLPLINPMLRTMAGGNGSATDVLVALGACVLSLAISAVSTAVAADRA